MANYTVNYDDQRFKNVESAKQDALNQVNNTYDNMINKADQYYQQMIDNNNQYAEKQQQLQQEKTDFAIEEINQNKEKLEKDYNKEQKASYVDYQKTINPYGTTAENQASAGIAQDSGISESAKVNAWGAYQNRYSVARDSYNQGVQNYDNAITQARLANNSALAEIAYQALTASIELSLQGFQYNNDLLEKKLAAQQGINTEFYGRWKDVLNQINNENALKEEQRQFDAQMAEKKRQYNSSYSSSNSANYSYGSSSNSSGQIKTDYYSGSINPDCKYGTFGTKDKNGVNYQPDNINGVKLKSSGKTISQLLGTKGNTGKTGANIDNQTAWQIGDNYYAWDGSQNKYVQLNVKTFSISYNEDYR